MPGPQHVLADTYDAPSSNSGYNWNYFDDIQSHDRNDSDAEIQPPDPVASPYFDDAQSLSENHSGGFGSSDFDDAQSHYGNNSYAETQPGYPVALPWFNDVRSPSTHNRDAGTRPLDLGHFYNVRHYYGHDSDAKTQPLDPAYLSDGESPDGHDSDAKTQPLDPAAAVHFNEDVQRDDTNDSDAETEPLEPAASWAISPPITAPFAEAYFNENFQSHDGNDSHAGTQPLEPAAASATSPITAAHDVWRDFQPVPGSKTKQLIFHRAPFKWGPWTHEQLEDRFSFVVGELQALVHRHLRLNDFTHCPVYDPRMVGPSPSEARPAIVVRCRQDDFKIIRSLFHAKAEGPLCLGKEPTVSYGGSLIRRRPDETASSIPRFQLVYYRTLQTPITRSTLNKPLLVSFGVGSVACGGIVRYGERSATLGVAIEVGDKIGILTVDHLFSSEKVHQGEFHQQSWALDGLPWSSLSDDSDADDEYEDLDEPSGSLQHNPEMADPAEVLRTEELEREPARWEWKLLASSTGLTASPSPAYLDWALTYPESTTPGVSDVSLNTVFPSGDRGKRVTLREMQRAPTSHLASVYIVSGIRGVLGGQILQTASLLPGNTANQEPCQAWTVILDEPDGRGEHFPLSQSN